MKSYNGLINYYRVFDVGADIDLVNSVSLLNSSSNTVETFKLRKSSRAIVIEDAPLSVGLASWIYENAGRNYECETTIKIWPFGAISLCFSFTVSNCSIDELKLISKAIEDSSDLHELAVERVSDLVKQLQHSIKFKNIWDQFEDYLIFIDKNTSRDVFEIQELMKNDDLFQIILGDHEGKFSEQMKLPIKNSIYQYHSDDFVIIDWNSAYICSEGDYQDIADVMEFAICQLLELRYYDDLLDRKLGSLYKSIQTTDPSFFNKNYNRISQEAAEIYIETSEVVEKIENSMKVIGDFYYAKIFRASVDRLRIKDWQQSVDNKLKNLLEVSSLFQAEVNNKKAFWMELIIIILIAVEVIPFLYKIIEKFIIIK